MIWFIGQLAKIFGIYNSREHMNLEIFSEISPFSENVQSTMKYLSNVSLQTFFIKPELGGEEN